VKRVWRVFTHDQVLHRVAQLRRLLVQNLSLVVRRLVLQGSCDLCGNESLVVTIRARELAERGANREERKQTTTSFKAAVPR
jgi:hypothetical protein